MRSIEEVLLIQIRSLKSLRFKVKSMSKFSLVYMYHEKNIGRNINCKGDTYYETDNIRVKRQKFDNTKKD